MCLCGEIFIEKVIPNLGPQPVSRKRNSDVCVANTGSHFIPWRCAIFGERLEVNLEKSISILTGIVTLFSGVWGYCFPAHVRWSMCKRPCHVLGRVACTSCSADIFLSTCHTKRSPKSNTKAKRISLYHGPITLTNLNVDGSMKYVSCKCFTQIQATASPLCTVWAQCLHLVSWLVVLLLHRRGQSQCNAMQSPLEVYSKS